MTRHFLVATLALGLLISCTPNKKSQSTPAAGADKQTEGKVLAEVNGQTLTQEDLQYQLPREYRDQLSEKDINDAVDNWINTELLYERGVKMGLDKDPEVEAIMRFRKGDAVARRLIELEISEKYTAAPHDVDSIYSAQKDMYKIDKERLRASHILVATKDEADAVYTRLKKGDSFAKLAQDYSMDKQSAANGGDLGFFTAEQIDPDFFKAAMNMKIGEYSQPVKTTYGYHLILLTDRQAAGASMDSVEVKNKISQDLTSARQTQAFNALLDSLKSSAKIERFTSGDTTSSTVPGAK